MKTIMRNLTGALLLAGAALVTAQPQDATHELRLSDIRARQPRETIFASAPCQRTRESPRHSIVQRLAIDPNTLVQNLGALTEKSDEVILAGVLDHATVLSPSGESTAMYYEARIIRSWKGSHHAGDVLTFGVPGGRVLCAPSGFDRSFFWALPAGNDWGFPDRGPLVYVLFLRQSKDDETRAVQGLRLAAGEGVQGMFMIQVPYPIHPFDPDAERYCAGVLQGSVQHCDSYLETSQSPIMVPYARDPLAKRYGGRPASDFLHEVQSVAASQGLAEKPSSQ
ncbi:MAG: hypothetical protein WBF42_19460 [Terracidiphilus sp.]